MKLSGRVARIGQRGNYCLILVGQHPDQTGMYVRITGLLIRILYIRLGIIIGCNGNWVLALSSS